MSFDWFVYNFKKIIIMLILSLLFFSDLKAEIIIGESKNKLVIGGEFNLALFNNLQNSDIVNFVDNNNYKSKLRLNFINQNISGLDVSFMLESFLSNEIYDYDKEIRDFFALSQFHITLKSSALGIAQFGKIKSPINLGTVGLTNKSGISILDAGYTFTSQGSLGDKTGEDFSTITIAKGILYTNQYDNLSTHVYIGAPKDRLSSRHEAEKDIVAQKDLSFGAAVTYATEKLSFGLAYEKADIKIIKDTTNPLVSDSISYNMTYSENFISAVAVSFPKAYLALSMGYYANSKLFGINHWGASIFANYNLTKITPYIGYQVLYADGIKDKTVGDNFDIYSLRNSPNYSFDQSYIVLGMSYKVSQHLLIGIEHNNDIRTSSHIATSILSPKHNDISMIYISYKV